jgi:glycosyltransferase involved in cell wall biosynthesis
MARSYLYEDTTMISCYTLCLNDDEWLTQALSYAASVADEVIVVDGGSTDNSIDIVNAFAAQCPKVRLHHNPMPDSFAQQRNHAIDLCSGDWVLQLDADEQYTRGLKERLLPTLQNVPSEIVGFSFPTYHLAVDGRHYQNAEVDPHIRLFRKLPNLRYERPVHEYLSLDGQGLIAHPAHFTDLERRVVRYEPNIRLLHYGSLRSDRSFQMWRDRWQRFAERSSEYGIDVNAKVRYPKAIGEIPESELPR